VTINQYSNSITGKHIPGRQA